VRHLKAPVSPSPPIPQGCIRFQWRGEAARPKKREPRPDRFYRRRCLVCERDLSRDPMTGAALELGRRKFCGQKCQSEHRRFPRVYSVVASGSYTPSAEHRSDSKSAHSTGLKTRLRVVRGSGDPAVEHRIGPGDYPVNILGGHRWPDALKLGDVRETLLWCEVCAPPDDDLAEAA
jgi:hypothetical protein